ncbi:MAG: peptidase M22 [Clostridia bacterium]|nr:peptidase M22 [Clostridia bacterium]
MSNKIFVGIDTSNYTTSCAIANGNGEILHNFKLLLPVKEGERGLRQSDAVFAHIKNLKVIANMIRDNCKNGEILAIGYSAFPRDVQGSYMPCFLTGEAVAQMLSAFCEAEIYSFSHQAGHIRAAIYSSGAELKESFISFHVSGGTTEVLKVMLDSNGYYKIEQIGGSIDLHAGQAIDRIGVNMGLSFPCGKEMERFAMNFAGKIPNYQICVNNFECNLSGLENIAIKLYRESNDKALVSAFVIDFLGKTLEKITQNLRNEYKLLPIVYAGGVMSNSIIQDRLKNKFKDVYFATPEFSTDNASGIALLTREKYINSKK